MNYLLPRKLQSISRQWRPRFTSLFPALALVSGCGFASIFGIVPQADAQVAATPTSISWASVAIGNTGGQKVATLTNSGSSQITVNPVNNASFSGTNAGDFAVFSTTCGSTLAASASCTANIVFRPTATGTRTATLNFFDSAGNSPQQITVSGLGTSGTSGSVTASPTSLSFGNVNTGSTSASQTATVTNGTSSSVTLSGAGLTGTDAADFTSSTTCGSSLAASASCTASVAFKPNTTGTLTASWSITSSSSSTPLTVALSGSGTTSTGGSASASPTSLTWGNVAFGNTGGAKTVTLTNSGSSAISFSGITFTGADPNDFYATNTCGTSVAASGICTASVYFRPTTAGTRTAVLNLNDSASNSPQTVSLSGTGTSNTSGSVTTSPSSLNFGSVDVGSSSSTMSAALSNATASSITISGVSITGSDYSISSNGCGSTLASSASCSVSVIFKPTTGGTRAATLSFADSASNSPQVVSLTGSGISSSSGTATASPMSITFGSFPVDTASGTRFVTLKNNGTTTFSIRSISIPNTSDFYETTQSCGTGLAPSATCTIQVIFDPTTTGTRTATLTISDGASNSPQTVALIGTGTPAPTTSLAISPGSSSWGSQTVGTTVNKSFTLTAGGSGSLTINSITTVGVNGVTDRGTGDFKIVSNTCSSTLAAGSNPCTITVSFNPSAIGNRVALLSVADTGIASPQTAEISGNGAYSAAQCAGSGSCAITVDFGSRSGSQVPIAANILGSEYIESLPSNPNRTTVFQGGFTTARYRTQLQTIFPSSANAPSWGLLHSDMSKLQTEGVKAVIMEVENSPTFLQPKPLICGTSAETSVPTSAGSLQAGAQAWGGLVAQLVQYMDTNFPNLARYYEIWNEPNTAALCHSFAGETSAEKANDYFNIYAAAAPQIKNQWTTDHSANSNLLPIFTGGPATAGVDGNYTPLVTNSSTAPNVDFYSYHLYLGSATTIKNGMTWDIATTSTTPELYQMETNTSAGIGARFLQAYKIVASSATPLKAKTPIFYDEYNDDFAFEPDCCRNHPLYGPLYNSVAVEQVLNQVYKGAGQVPSNMIYFAAAQNTFCILGIIDSAMDCSKAATEAQAQPYPQWYTYKLIFNPSYLDLQDGGHMATSVTLSPGALSSGLLATAFYTPPPVSTDSILIINSLGTSFSGVTLQINNSGLSSPTSTLYALNAECTSSADPQTCAFAPNAYISSWPATTIPVSGGTQVTFDIPAHSVLAISLK